MVLQSGKRLVKALFKRLGFTIAKRDWMAELIPADYHQSPYLPRMYRESIGRLLYFKTMLERIQYVDGDLVECGVSIGHGLLYFMLLGELIGKNRQVFGFDSFEGFHQSEKEDLKADGTFQ